MICADLIVFQGSEVKEIVIGWSCRFDEIRK
jgi:hypothetical protein